jgi:hypothetical protein
MGAPGTEAHGTGIRKLGIKAQATKRRAARTRGTGPGGSVVIQPDERLRRYSLSFDFLYCSYSLSQANARGMSLGRIRTLGP